MRKGESSNRFGFRILLLALAGLIAGCAGPSAFRGFQSIEQRRGILRWQQPNGNGLTAESYFSRGGDGAISLVIGKEGPTPLLEGILQNGTASFRGPLLGGLAWAGPVNAAPKSLAPWAALLSAYAQGATLADGSQEVHTGAYRAQFQKSAGRLTAFYVVCNDTGDSFTVRF
ncbi:MAG TPA: hypothetical protein VIS74_04590 [Chthoniobacterales bacterium]